MREIYLLLTRSTTLFSQLIALSTDAPYTHVSIGFDPSLSAFYSFARRNPSLPLPAGLVREELGGGYFGLHPDTPCLLLSLPVEDNIYHSLRHRVDQMMSRASEYHYSLLGVILCKLDVAHRRKMHYFCSQFVAQLLADTGAQTLPRDPSLMQPVDFTKIPDLTQHFCGTVGQLAAATTSEETVYAAAPQPAMLQHS